MTRRLTLFQLNDLHGYLQPHPEIVWDDGKARFPVMGGLARISTVLEEARERDMCVVALDNGDTFHGTHIAVASKGEALLPILNRLGLDGMSAHWDFAWGPAHLKQLVRRLEHPLLACNCFDNETGQLTFPASRLIDRNGLRIGVIGIAATIVDKSMPPHFSEGVRLTNGLEELPAHIERLRYEDHADVIVVLSHLGFPQDVKLAHAVKGIDVLLSGHTHNRLTRPVCVDGAILIQSGCHGSYLGRLDLQVGPNGVRLQDHRLIPIDERVAENPDVAALVEAALAPSRTEMARVVGHTRTALHRATTLEAPMDHLLLDAIAEAAGTRIAFSNGWRYGAPIPPGPITVNDLWNIIPTNPPVSTVDLTGREILEMLEENLERTFAADPFDQVGGFVKRCRNIHLYGKAENPKGHRIERLFVEGAPVNFDHTYRAAFVTMQAVPPRLGRNRRDEDIHAIEALERYLARRPEIVIELRHNVCLA